MARFRWLSTFTLLGILLVILGIVGKVLGPRFIYDPGQVPDGNEAWAYIAVGILMLLNGFLSPAPPDSDPPSSPRSANGRVSSVPSAPAVASRAGDRSTD
jgi:hypothetical protein